MATALLQRLSRTFSAPPAFARALNTRPVIPNKLDPATHRIGYAPHYRPAPSIKEPVDFLKRIGRGADTKITVESWAEFWRMDGAAMKKAGVDIRDRRYILWCMEKYRLGFPIEQFAHEPRPKKTIRGWGPKVQNGKLIRSRRIKDKTKKAPVGRPISLA